ncbi:unnamed protein product [Clavelina lepadiformis]|uniref:EH domain-containing protein n=1 Tax=Clavelina lepadiformis TaxID=159417 RepID=A0ABP0GZY1_CLALP
MMNKDQSDHNFQGNRFNPPIGMNPMNFLQSHPIDQSQYQQQSMFVGGVSNMYSSNPQAVLGSMSNPHLYANQNTMPAQPKQHLVHEKHERYKLEQQQKFKSFGQNFKHTSIESMLSDIVGSSRQEKKKECLQAEDDYGDFLQATQPSVPVNPLPPVTNLSHNLYESHRQDNSHIVASSAASTDLQSKMLESLDLNASQPKYMNFKPMHTIGSRHSPMKSFQPSAKAADWTSKNLEGVGFQSNDQQLKPETSNSLGFSNLSASWLLDVAQVPLLYKQVFEACVTSDGLVDIMKIRSILLLSKLSNETLGNLWAKANQALPGRLNQRELYILLGLIALAQNGQHNPSVDYLLNLTSAPIPCLDNMQKVSLSNTQETPLQESKSSAVTNNTEDEFDDFQDFQSAQFSESLSPTTSMACNNLKLTKLDIPEMSMGNSSMAVENTISSNICNVHPVFSTASIAGSKETPLTNKTHAIPSETFLSGLNVQQTFNQVNVDKTQPLSSNLLGKKDKYAVFHGMNDFVQSVQSEVQPEVLLQSGLPDVDPPSYTSVINSHGTWQDPAKLTGQNGFTDFVSSYKADLFVSKSAVNDDSVPSTTATETTLTVTQSHANSDVKENHDNLPYSERKTTADIQGLLKHDRYAAIISETDNVSTQSDNDSVKSLQFTTAFQSNPNPNGLTDSIKMDSTSMSVKGSIKSPIHNLRSLPSFEDDSPGYFEPPPDMGLDSFDEFDEFQEGKSTLTNFDVFADVNHLKSKTDHKQHIKVDEDIDRMTKEQPVSEVISNLDEDFNSHESLEESSVSIKETGPSDTSMISITDNTNDLIHQKDVIESLASSKVNWQVDSVTEGDNTTFAESWEKLLQTCFYMISKANDTLCSIQSPSICNEVVYSCKGQRYISDLGEIYGIARRVCHSMHLVKIEKNQHQQLHKQIELAWNNLVAFCPSITVEEMHEIGTVKDTVCGVCLSKAKGNQIRYAGIDYHSTCANFWVNCVAPVLPALKMPAFVQVSS